MAELLAAPEIEIHLIHVKNDRGRKEFDRDKMASLAESIKQNGVMQPLIVTDEIINGEMKYVLVGGERRYRACLIAGLAKVPYRWYKTLSLLEQKRMELQENTERDDLKWPEKNELIAQQIALETQLRGVKRNDPNAFKLSDLTPVVNLEPSNISIRANFHDECKARPDIFEKIKDKPMNAAMSEMKRIKQAETAQKQVEAKKLTINNDFQNGDCTELIMHVRDTSVDMICADMPFAIPELGDRQNEAQIYKAQMKQTDNLSTEEMVKIIEKLAPQWYRVMKPSSYGYVFFGWDTKHHLETTLRQFGFDVDVEPIIWYKGMTTSSWKGYSPAPCYEQILQFIKPPRSKRQAQPWKRILDGTREERFAPVKKDLRSHPFEKPVGLLSFLISQVTNVGEVVMDNFAGTGSTILAAMELKRNVIAHELNQQHYFIGQSRVADLSVRLADVTAK